MQVYNKIPGRMITIGIISDASNFHPIILTILYNHTIVLLTHLFIHSIHFLTLPTLSSIHPPKWILTLNSGAKKTVQERVELTHEGFYTATEISSLILTLNKIIGMEKDG